MKLNRKILKLPEYKEFFQKVSAADTLYADRMNLTIFPIFVVRSLPNITTIDLSGNHLRRIPNKMNKISKKLEKLLVSDNRIIIPKQHPLLSSRTLQTLMLSNNEIKRLFKETFAMLPALEVLYLDSNKIKSIAPILNTLPSLKYIHLGKNYLTSIPPKNLVSPSLEYYITKSQQVIKKREVKKLTKKLRHSRLM